MSLVFSDTTNKDGIIQHIERELEYDYGRISDDTERMAEVTADVNLAIDAVAAIHAELGGSWQQDDRNHSSYPIVDANLVAGQADYTFDEDSSGNRITDIYKVMIKQSATSDYVTLPMLDQQSPSTDQDAFSATAQGTPNKADLTGNAVFLAPIPDTDITDGIRVFVGREGSYFAVSDTTKKPGFDGRFHYYPVLWTCEKHARIHQLNNFDLIRAARIEMEMMMREVISKKNRSERRRFIPLIESTR